jgi:hypothetical protein
LNVVAVELVANGVQHTMQTLMLDLSGKVLIAGECAMNVVVNLALIDGASLRLHNLHRLNE